MKKIFLILIILFICGLVSADICVSALQDHSVLLTLERFTQYANETIAFKNIFWGIVYERVKFFVFMMLILLTPLQNKMVAIASCIFSFFWGFFFMSCINALGMAGLIVGVMSILPHGVLYLAAFMVSMQRKQSRRYIERHQIGRNILSYVIVAMLFITGCILECVIGTQFIPWIIRLSLV